MKKFLSKAKNIIYSSYLCIKYPFLYPRNRFDGKHHNRFLNSWIWKLYKESTLEIGISITHLDKDTPIPKTKYDTNIPGLSVMITPNNIVEVKFRGECNYKNLATDLKDQFIIIGYRIRKPWIAGGNPNIIIYVNKLDEDGKRYGFIYRRVIFITNKFLNKLGNILEWIDTKVLDKIFILPDRTELDALEPGWRKAFGLQICEEIKQALLKKGGRKMLNNYRIDQIKEKWGYLHWYDHNSIPEVENIIHKYKYISEHTCINCGRPAKYMSKGWISPFCEYCIKDPELASVIK